MKTELFLVMLLTMGFERSCGGWWHDAWQYLVAWNPECHEWDVEFYDEHGFVRVRSFASPEMVLGFVTTLRSN